MVQWEADLSGTSPPNMCPEYMKQALQSIVKTAKMFKISVLHVISERHNEEKKDFI